MEFLTIIESVYQKYGFVKKAGNEAIWPMFSIKLCHQNVSSLSSEEQLVVHYLPPLINTNNPICYTLCGLEDALFGS